MAKRIMWNAGKEATPKLSKLGASISGYFPADKPFAVCAVHATKEDRDEGGFSVPIYTRMCWPEVDSPLSCDVCGALLPCSLTSDGREYVENACAEKDTKVTRLWRNFFDIKDKEKD